MTLLGIPKTAIEFLRRWPTAFVHLVAIHIDPVTHEKVSPKDGGIEGHSFKDTELEDNGPAAQWILERNKTANIYFTVNSLRAPMVGKPKKTDIAEVVAFHVDIDVPAGEAQEAGAAKLVEALRDYKLDPTVIINSGGGAQGFWELSPSDRIKIDGDVAKAEEAERYTRALEASFSGLRGAKPDACHNVDRIMRLPFTDNIPDAKKIAKGRVRSPATLVMYDDLRQPLSAFDKAPPKGAARPTALAAPEAPLTSLDDARLKKVPNDIIEAIKTGKLPDGDEPHFPIVCAMLRAGCSAFVIKAAYRLGKISEGASAWPRKFDGEMDRVIANASAAVARTEDGRPRILFDELNLTKMLDETEAAMRERGAGIYATGARLVHVYRQDRDDSADAPVRRKAGSLGIHDIGERRLREHVSQHVQFYKEGKRGQMDVAVPPGIVPHLRDRGDLWKWPVLNGIAQTPTIDRDGRVVAQEGYDAQTHMVFDFGGMAFPPVPENPSEEESRAALALIKQPYEEFPFVDDASRSVALSSAITAIVRPALLGGVPLHGFDASTPATGKTLCANVAPQIATGREAAAMTFGWDDAENEKRLTGSLLAGDRLLLLDNAKRPIDGELLNVMITGEVASVRMLGQTGQLTVPCSATILATGNNLQFEADMVSRVIVARLDAKMERPEERAGFKRNLATWLPEHRAELVAAVLTIVRGYICGGRPWPQGLKPTRFPDWDRTVRGALLWLGEADPTLTMEKVAALDSVRGNLGDVLRALRNHSKLKAGAFSTSDLERLTKDSGPLQNVFAAVMPKGVTAKGLTAYLKSNANRIIDGHYIDCFPDKNAGALRFRLMAIQAQGEFAA